MLTKITYMVPNLNNYNDKCVMLISLLYLPKLNLASLCQSIVAADPCLANSNLDVYTSAYEIIPL